jgi:hypothetical protein
VSWEVIPPTGGKPVVTAVFEGHLSAEKPYEFVNAHETEPKERAS